MDYPTAERRTTRKCGAMDDRLSNEVLKSSGMDKFSFVQDLTYCIDVKKKIKKLNKEQNIRNNKNLEKHGK